MLSNFVLLSSLYLASAALAVPHSRLGALPARHMSSIPWAGASVTRRSGSFTRVQAHIVVPDVTVDPLISEGVTSFGVGILGPGCHPLQAGITVTVLNGNVSWSTWYETVGGLRFPPSNDSDLCISAGDVVVIHAQHHDRTRSDVVIQDETSGGAAQWKHTFSSELCDEVARWFVEAVPDRRLANFGSVTFVDASGGSDDDHEMDPSDGILQNITQGNVNLTPAIQDGNLVVTFNAHPPH